MAEVKPARKGPSAREIALWFAEGVQTVLDKQAARPKPAKTIPEISKAIEAAADPVVLLLAGVLVTPLAAAGVKALLTLFAQVIAPDPEILHKVERKLDVIIEAPLRTGLDVLLLSLKGEGPASQKEYLDSRLQNAQQNLDSRMEPARGRESSKHDSRGGLVTN